MIPKGQSKLDNPAKVTTLSTQDEDKQKTQHNMCWTPPYTRRRQQTNQKHTTQYVLDTTMHKQAHIT